MLLTLLPTATSSPSGATGAVRVAACATGYLLQDQDEPRRLADLPAAVEAVLEACNRLALHQCRDFAVHAGAVARNGQVVALPASSGTGKTTLVACLLQQGWSYVSDEALVLTSAGVVRPYPKWLSIHEWTLTRLGVAPPQAGRCERPVPVSELSSASATGQLHLAHIALLTRRPGPPALTRESSARGAASLLHYSFNHYRDPKGSVALCTAVARGASTWSLEVEDPVAAARLLTATIG